MTSRDFCYWLQGYFEILGAAPDDIVGNLCEKRVETIKNHLAMVFKHEIDPSFGDKKHQDDLAKIHQSLQGIFDAKTIQTAAVNC